MTISVRCAYHITVCWHCQCVLSSEKFNFILVRFSFQCMRSIQQQQQKYILRIVTNHTWSCGPIYTYIYYSANVMLAFIYIHSRIQTIGIAGLGRTGTPNTRFQRPEFFSSLEICRANKKWNKQKSESKWLLWLWIFHGLPNAHGHTNHFHFGAGWLAMFACFSILYFSCVFK